MIMYIHKQSELTTEVFDSSFSKYSISILTEYQLRTAITVKLYSLIHVLNQ